MSLSKITHSGNVLLAGFFSLLVMMSVLVYLAIKQDIPMVGKDYYEQELVYQQKLDAMNNANPYDEGFSVTKDGDQIILQIPPALSKSITSGSVYFYCPAVEKMDRKKALAANASGYYQFESIALPPVSYIVKISFRSGGRDYYKELTLN